LIEANRSVIDAASGGAFYKKNPTKARKLITTMAANNQQFKSRSDNPPRKKILNKPKLVAYAHLRDTPPMLAPRYMRNLPSMPMPLAVFLDNNKRDTTHSPIPTIPDGEITQFEGKIEEELEIHPKQAKESDQVSNDIPKVLVTKPPFPERFAKAKKGEEERALKTFRKVEDTGVVIKLADCSIVYPKGVLEDVLVQVNELAPTLELKELPKHLKYALLGEKDTLPVIVSSKLSTLEEEKLIRVLREFCEAIGCSIADIKRLSPSTCMHRILLEGMIFPISDSEWVSPTQVVPKKIGHIVSSRAIEVDQAQIDVIKSLPYPASVREIPSFLGHAGFIDALSRTSPKSLNLYASWAKR
ncbi:UNVERIFIED_CONTAM: hypothetical protein Scaly_1006600, partial [Sesamum calycinum]